VVVAEVAVLPAVVVVAAEVPALPAVVVVGDAALDPQAAAMVPITSRPAMLRNARYVRL
jgi:hypothetical protein